MGGLALAKKETITANCDERKVCNHDGKVAADSAQTSPMAVSDGAGGMLVAWSDRRAGNRDIYVQRVLHNGAVPPLAVPDAGPPPHLALALANPARAPIRLSLTLADAGLGRVELLDAAGRLVDARDTSGPGEHAVLLGSRSLPSGFYWVRLTQGARHTARRVCVLR